MGAPGSRRRARPRSCSLAASSGTKLHFLLREQAPRHPSGASPRRRRRRMRLDGVGRSADVRPMPRMRRRAATWMLAWMALGLLASAGMGHTARPALPPCHEAAPPPSGAPARDAAPPGREMPCQWALPLLCCQQPLAADAASPGLVTLVALWVHAIDPVFAPLPSALRAAPVSLQSSAAPPLERSVVLQV